MQMIARLLSHSVPSCSEDGLKHRRWLYERYAEHDVAGMTARIT